MRCEKAVSSQIGSRNGTVIERERKRERIKREKRELAIGGEKREREGEGGQTDA